MRWLALAAATSALVPAPRQRRITRIRALPQATVDLKARAQGLLEDVERNLADGAALPGSAQTLRAAYATDVGAGVRGRFFNAAGAAWRARCGASLLEAGRVASEPRPRPAVAAIARGRRLSTARPRRDRRSRIPCGCPSHALAARMNAVRPRREHVPAQEHNDIYVAFLEFFMDLKLDYDVSEGDGSLGSDSICPSSNPLTDLEDKDTREKLPMLYRTAMTMLDGATPEVQLGIWKLVVDKLIDRTGMSNKEFVAWSASCLKDA